MELIILLGGVFIGIAIGKPKKIQGIIDVDHDTNMCRINVNHKELLNRKLKTATIYINHDAAISREEQTL